MKPKKIVKKGAELLANVATKTLKVEANSASCMLAHQPKAPKELARFKK